MSHRTPEYWLEDIGSHGLPHGRFYKLFGDDEITCAEAKRLAALVGIELAYSTQDMPERMVEEGDCLDAQYLAQVDRPEWSNRGGWVLRGAEDTEDGEILLTYARPFSQGVKL
ncbi:hypothetical protein K6L44_06680 [Gluconacetobacter entanii]|uniref:hypothetical protein n=1 Tax=Gluconacetobacter entanii TaxID=108528 RepID=UPI001C933F89|nr:hypothetical protein [Gluconacetobacter entanii]MBY4639687.1 hypothetical protein [Gluconacetobacter entanii]MCW4579187.1 hypothetical protein [Gluconacetobacter entanii]MCW4582577.1 hypothetical protein [Gluconacetobacter entanii]MCW4585974.1 hypothetical protein [Gluconacetobacter entanii]